MNEIQMEEMINRAKYVGAQDLLIKLYDHDPLATPSFAEARIALKELNDIYKRPPTTKE